MTLFYTSTMAKSMTTQSPAKNKGEKLELEVTYLLSMSVIVQEIISQHNSQKKRVTETLLCGTIHSPKICN